MDFQQNFGVHPPAMHLGNEGDIPQIQKSIQMSQSPENLNGCFDCNICLDSCHDPVVTLCGHLYCWPCIYRWLQVESTSFESNERPRCPVCKAYISTTSVVPLYGRGRPASESEKKKTQWGLTIPHRPPALGTNAMLSTETSLSSDSDQINPNMFQPENTTFHQEHHFSYPFNNYSTSLLSPTMNMVSELVFAGIFGNSNSNLFAYPYTNSYPFPGNDSPRLRRHEMQLDKSLNRLSIFLLCCIALCLILF